MLDPDVVAVPVPVAVPVEKPEDVLVPVAVPVVEPETAEELLPEAAAELSEVAGGIDTTGEESPAGIDAGAG